MIKQATNLRAELSRELYPNFKSEYANSDSAKKLIKGTLFEEFLFTSNLDAKEIEKFAFSHYVTNSILNRLLSEIKSIDDVFNVSKIVEQGYFKLISDFKTLKLKNNLSVSKEFGAFFTPIKISREMAEAAVNGSKSKVIIDPCCGTGNLLAACVEYAKANDIKLKKIIGIELDPFSANLTRNILHVFTKAINYDVEIEIINADATRVLSKQGSLFDSNLENGTFIINPPYGKLKFESDKLTNNETKLSTNKNHIESKRSYIEERKLSIFSALSGLNIEKGGIEWSKVFLALCTGTLSEGESLVFIGPCGWLNNTIVQRAKTRRRNQQIMDNSRRALPPWQTNRQRPYL